MSRQTEHTQAAVLFVCLGNICRSPTAQGVFEHKLARSAHAGAVETDSAGTGDWHVGKAPDARARQAAASRGYRIDHLRARQVTPDDFHRFDWILAMDASNLAHLQAMKPEGSRAQLAMFLEPLGDAFESEVPDPYYGGDAGFAHVLDLCEAASDAWLMRLGSSANENKD